MKKRILLGCLMAFCPVAISALACLLEASCFDIICNCHYSYLESTPLEYLLILPSFGILLSLVLMFGLGSLIAWIGTKWARVSWKKESVLGVLLASGALSVLGLFYFGMHIYRCAAFYNGSLVSSFPLDSERGYANALAIDITVVAIALPVFIFALRHWIKELRVKKMERTFSTWGRGIFAFFFACSFLSLPIFYAFGFTAYLAGEVTIYGFNPNLVFAYSNLSLLPFLCFAGAKIWMERASKKKEERM